MKSRQLIARSFFGLFGGAVIAFGALASPEPSSMIETSWLEPEAGSKGEVIGSSVASVSSEGELTTVDVALPVKDLLSYTPVVEVSPHANARKDGKDMGQKKVTLVEPVKFLSHEDGKPYGIRFKVKGAKDFEFRVQLKEGEDH